MIAHDIKNDDARTPAEILHARIDVGGALQDLERVGRLWAHYGLTLSRLAVETSAETLRGTARMLGRLAAGFEETRSADAGPREAAHS